MKTYILIFKSEAQHILKMFLLCSYSCKQCSYKKKSVCSGFFVFFCSFTNFIYVQYKKNRGKSYPWGLWVKSEENRPIFNAGCTGVCTRVLTHVWFHIVKLGKIPFHFIGRTLYFCKEFRFSFLSHHYKKVMVAQNLKTISV